MKNLFKKLIESFSFRTGSGEPISSIAFEGPVRKVVMTFKQKSGEKNFRCMICGYLGLERRQFANRPEVAHPKSVTPPYSQSWGEASYEVCGCCGYEAGNDDSFSSDVNFPTQYLVEWYRDGQKWMSPEEKPTRWSLIAQLTSAGIPVPQEIGRND